MNKEELIILADKLGIDHYNECDDYICLKGINGQITLLYTSAGIQDMVDRYKNHYNDKKEIARMINALATELDFATHLKQMGRDSLKMDLDRLLNVMTHA
jgi:hypothetical protein